MNLNVSLLFSYSCYLALSSNLKPQKECLTELENWQFDGKFICYRFRRWVRTPSFYVSISRWNAVKICIKNTRCLVLWKEISVKGNCIKSHVPVLVLFEEDCCVSLLINIVICQISPDITRYHQNITSKKGRVRACYITS